jgi:hypothetical protein
MKTHSKKNAVTVSKKSPMKKQNKPFVVTCANINEVIVQMPKPSRLTFLIPKNHFRIIAKASGWTKKQIDNILTK